MTQAPASAAWAAPAHPPAAHPAAPASPGSADATPAPERRAPADDGGGHRGVAVLLALTAILAAVIGARSTALANSASDDWQSALRTEVKRSTAAISDIHLLYQAEIPAAVNVLSFRLQETEARSAAAAATGSDAIILGEEADTAKSVLSAVEPSVELAKPEYALPGGGVDIGKRLATLRAEDPKLVALDPDAIQAEGDALGAKASWMTLGLLPLGLAALFGALAQPFGGSRRLLLGMGGMSLAGGALIAAIVEVLV
ncbi:MAG: hypothetical protein WCK58_15765 [Chloroflexota bacterium]